MDKTLIQPIYPQLRFGVELSRLYPPWYVHPALKNLIYETKINTERRKEFTLNEILSQDPSHSHEEGLNAYHFAHREFVSETLYLKDRLISGKNILGINASPGVHVWLLRHFLGLLPSPLFPKDSTKPNLWMCISKQCKDALIMMKIKNNSTNECIEDLIVGEVTRLPSRNISLIFELFELFRSLGTRLFVKSEIDKRSAIAIVRYFTPSLFTRPYRIDVITNNDERLFAFVLYMIFFWPSIKEKCQRDLVALSEKSEPSKLYYLGDIGEEIEEDLENIVDELLLRDRDSRESPKTSPKKRPAEKYSSSDEEPTYLADNFTQTSQLSFEFHTTENNKTSTPYQTAENTNLTEDENQSCFSQLKKSASLLKSVQTDTISLNSKTFKNSKVFPDMKNDENQFIYEKEPIISTSKLSDITEEDSIANKTTHVSFLKDDSGTESKQKLDDKNSEIKINSLNATFDVCDKKSVSKEVVQVFSPKMTNKVVSSKVARMSRRFRKGSQIIILHINPCKCSMKKSKPKRKQTKWDESDVFEEKNNYESLEKSSDQSNKVQNTPILDLPNFCCNYTKNTNSNFGNVRPQYGWNRSTCSTENEGYIFDSFIDNPQNYKTFEVFAPSNPFSPSNYAINSPETLKERMAKIGWTYGETSGESTPIPAPKNPPYNQYELCFESERTSKKDSNIFNSLRKVGSKLNIFKGLSPKFSNHSLSAENLLKYHDVKYEKLPKRANSL